MKDQDGQDATAPRGVLPLVLTYATVAGLWILLSDRAIGLLFRDPEALVQASTAKGAFFVAVTSLLLYVLVSRLVARTAAAHRRELALLRERQRVPAMLTALDDHTDDAIFVKDEAGRYLLFNRAAARFVGKPVEEVLGRNDDALFPPEQAAAIRAVDRHVLASGNIETGESVLHTVDGTRTFLDTKGPLRDSAGTVFGVFGISRDITERKRDENRLRLWAEAFSRSELAAAIVDATDNTFVSVNAAFARERGYVIEALAGKPLSTLYPPERVAALLERIAELDALGHATFESEHRGRDGRCLPVMLDITVLKSIAGKPLLRVVYAIDISARKAAEDALREREHRLAAIVGNSPSALSLKHPDGRYALANPNLQRILGRGEAAIVGRTDDELFPPDVARALRANDERVLATMTRQSIEEILPVDGAPRTYMSHIFPVLDDAGRAEFICRIALDITESRRGEEELRHHYDDVEHFNRNATGREMRMIELKREVNALAGALGRPAPYDLSFADAPRAGESP